MFSTQTVPSTWWIIHRPYLTGAYDNPCLGSITSLREYQIAPPEICYHLDNGACISASWFAGDTCLFTARHPAVGPQTQCPTPQQSVSHIPSSQYHSYHGHRRRAQCKKALQFLLIIECSGLHENLAETTAMSRRSLFVAVNVMGALSCQQRRLVRLV